MDRLSSLKTIAATAVAMAAFSAATAAHAGSDVFFSIGLPATAYVQPAPVYAQPQQYYAQPQQYYAQPEQYYAQPQQYYAQPEQYYAQPQYGQRWERRAAWAEREEHRHNHWHRAHLYGPNGDFDGDGVPNRFDRFPGDPYRR